MAAHPDHSTNLKALKRIEGQIRGISRMIEEREYCVDILLQIRAAMGALARVEEDVLERHFAGCVADAVKDGSAREKERKMAEVMDLIRRFRKT